jgi:hypothetical protein
LYRYKTAAVDDHPLLNGVLALSMGKTSFKEISAVLDDMPAKQLEAFIQGLRDQMAVLSSAQRRSETLALVVATAFILIEVAAIGPRATVGPFQITNLADIERFLPVLYAYFVYDDVVNASRYMFTRDVWDASIKVNDERLYRSGLDRLLVPPVSSLAGPWFIPGFVTPLTPILTVISRTMKIGAYSGILLLFGLAFWRLFLRFGIADPIVWLSLAASTGLLVFAVLVYTERALNYRTVGFLAVTDPRGDSASTAT